MTVSTAVTPDVIATALGKTAPVSLDSDRWQMWIDDAVRLIQFRVDKLEFTDLLDQDMVDYVVREAVVAQVDRPDSATQVTVSVDDGSTTKSYRSSKGRVTILDEWWTLLGLAEGGGSGAFSVDTVACATSHLPWCSFSLGALYCSCGADIAGFPIYEGADE